MADADVTAEQDLTVGVAVPAGHKLCPVCRGARVLTFDKTSRPCNACGNRGYVAK